MPGGARAILDSGGVRDSPASCAGLPEVLGPHRDGGRGARRRLDRAEEVESETFPVPVSVRGAAAAAAAAGAAMPKGGEGWGARGPRASRSGPNPAPAVPSACECLGELRRGHSSAPAEGQAWASTPNCLDGKLRTVVALSHSLAGLRGVGGSGSCRRGGPDLGRASPGLGGLEFPPTSRLAGD